MNTTETLKTWSVTDTFTAVDVETTGLSPEKNRIIEIGAVKYRDGVCVGEFSTFIHIDTPVPAQITELTGIDSMMLFDAPDEASAMREFLTFADTEVLLGHNLSFDYGFLKTAAVRNGFSFEYQGIDTLTLCRAFHKELPSRNLGAMCRFYEIDQGHAHRAFDDARATANLYFCLQKNFAGQDESAFSAETMQYRVKKQEPMTLKQKKYLIDLTKYHKIEVKQNMDTMTKSEASRLIDSIIFNYGRMGR